MEYEDVPIDVRYRGALADLDKLDSFEQRVLTLAKAGGVKAELAREKYGTVHPGIRGVIVYPSEEVEPLSLVLSARGRLLPLDKLDLEEPGELPWLSIQTSTRIIEIYQFIMHLLIDLEPYFLKNFEVEDPGGMWGDREEEREATEDHWQMRAIKLVGEKLQEQLKDVSANDKDAYAVGFIRATEQARRQFIEEFPFDPAVDPGQDIFEQVSPTLQAHFGYDRDKVDWNEPGHGAAIVVWREMAREAGWSSETAPKGILTTYRLHLRERGILMPEPEELDDESLSLKLWEVILSLAKANLFLTNTNHLTDRELYTIMSEILSYPRVLSIEDEPTCFDPTGQGKHNRDAWLNYYASEEDRRKWLEQHPGEELLEPGTPPFERDRLLPKPS